MQIMYFKNIITRTSTHMYETDEILFKTTKE